MPKRTLNDAFPSRYLKADDLEGKRFDAVIESVDYEKMQEGEEKPVAYFDGMKKGIVLNKTKASFLAELSKSNKFDDWVGQSVQISAGTTSLRGKDVPCIKFERTAAGKTKEIKEALNDAIPDLAPDEGKDLD